MKLLLLILGCFIFLSTGPVASRKPNRSQKIYYEYDRLARWIENNSKLNIYVTDPKFEFVPLKELNKNTKDELLTLGTYNTETHVVTLVKGFNPKRALHKSLLLHEMVHHYQAMNKLKYLCTDMREHLAYELQRKWMEENGLDFYKIIASKLFMLTISNCHFSRPS